MTDPLSPAPVLSLVSNTHVPNIFPTVDVPYRLVIVGEAPGADEEAHGRPFVGASGRLLDSILAGVGILRSGCLVANVSQHRPPGNDMSLWGYSHPKVLAGWEQLQKDLAVFRPNAILALGNTPLHFLTGRTGVSSWRGSILASPFGKVISAIHPAAILREYSDWPLLRFDAQRARAESETSTLVLPQRELLLDLSAYEICNRLDNWPAGRILSFDIEGGLEAFPCCSVVGEPNSGFIIAWNKHSESEQGRIAVSLSRALHSTAIPKCLQNSLYDRFVLAYAYRMLIRNVTEDTMLKQWEIYPELPKGLGTIGSIWTRGWQQYKHEGKAGNKNTVGYDPDDYYRYCIKDSCVTLEAAQTMSNVLTSTAHKHYRFNVDLLSPLLYMQLRGIAYDAVTAAIELLQVQASLLECSTRLELRVEPMQFTKKEFSNRIRGEKGCIGDKRLAMVMEAKGYPTQYKGRGPDKTKTCDVEALLNLQRKYTNDPFLADVLLHRKLESIAETLAVSTDPDGRVRCAYNLVGTETGRLTCYTSPTGSGANLQTITKKLRKLYRADEGYHLFQCDLAGADGWTVAARCLQHGDSTMWDDYSAGLKPALIVALMYLGTATNATSRADLLRLATAYKTWESEHEDQAWIYFACKQVQHGSNYGMQEQTMSANLLKTSYKITGKGIYIEPHICASLQRLYLSRYPGIYSWHNWAANELTRGADLTSASGHTRVFFGRRKSWDNRRKQMAADHETLKKFLADEPQENTTYATNLALHRLWHDPDNRINTSKGKDSHLCCRQQDVRVQDMAPKRVSSSIIIQPLHQVHDALIGQFPIAQTDWAVARIRSYFDNELTIANTKVTIPFEGAYGPSWGQLGSRYGGGDI